MAYNKSKFVEAAQKLLNQGKVPQAIAEYQHILKYEPKDQVTLMTIGELYIRQGETFQAIEYFERLAQIFVGDGFLTKAIAVYKRIAKLAPEEIKPLERLADLYVQQGVMSEARPLFLQLAEIHLKHNRQTEAVALLRKLLLAEPDNLRIQIRLADLYQAMGKPAEAVETYVSAAQRALAVVSRLRVPMLDSGEHDAVARLLNELASKMPGRLEPLEWLVDSYGRTSDSFRMPDALAQLGDALVAAKQLTRAKEVFEQLVDRQPESDSVKRKLNDVLRRMGLPAPDEEPEIVESLQAGIPQPEAPKLRPDIVTPPEERVA